MDKEAQSWFVGDFEAASDRWFRLNVSCVCCLFFVFLVTDCSFFCWPFKGCGLMSLLLFFVVSDSRFR